MKLKKGIAPFLPKEISWLHFNERVLQEASTPSNPLIERVKFLGIFSNNLDEFYRVRVASLLRILAQDGPSAKTMGVRVREVLKEIHDRVITQAEEFNRTFDEIFVAMEKNGIRLVNESSITPEQLNAVLQYYHTQVRPRLVPIMLDQHTAKAHIRDQFLYLAVVLHDVDGSTRKRMALIEVPTDSLSRFFLLPGPKGTDDIMLLEDVIRIGLPQIFAVFKPRTMESWTVKVTRDSELTMDDDISESYIKRIHESLKKREMGSAVRLVYDRSMPEFMLKIIRKMTGVHRQENLIPGGRLHNSKDFIKFPNLGRKALAYSPIQPIQHPAFANQVSVLKVLSKQDVLLQFPYHSFNVMLDFLREAAIDPKVSHIRLTVYRVASQSSSILNALINAVRNGKKVVVLMEVLARFDEGNNIYWAERLRNEGVNVIIGVRGLKVHSKLCLVTRKESSGVRHYATIGTGNFNEDTARIYTDHILMTGRQQITQEVLQVFEFFKNNFKVPKFKHLVISPFNTRDFFMNMIQKEIHNAKKGHKASIRIKLNNLADEGMIESLYQASKAGVRIQMIVRGMLSLRPEVVGLSENIEVISIVGRYLEHSRFMIFENKGDTRVYITSGDWMMRNLDQRVEVSCPIEDPHLRNMLITYFEMQWQDSEKARFCQEDQLNQYRIPQAKPYNSQNEIYKYLLTHA